ncbi:MAG: hypothetical protein PHY92_07675 [Alphaproteobacteria bacterium]|nr:hypothetical protein [Alphaproteobacteria bacterium]
MDKRLAQLTRELGLPKGSIDGQFRECWLDLFGNKRLPLKLTREIHIKPSGTRMIRVYPYADYERYETHRIDIYGDTSARITIYDVEVVPLSPARLSVLAHRVERALLEVAKQKPDFIIPQDSDGQKDAYARPYRYVIKDHEIFPDGEFLLYPSVNIEEGVIKIGGPLDLDDLLRFYKVLERWIEPSEQIAAAFDNARYIEARGPLLEKEPMGSCDKGYQYHHVFDPKDRQGYFRCDLKEDRFLDAIKVMRNLYLLGETTDIELAQQAVVLAGQSITGQTEVPAQIDPELFQAAQRAGIYMPTLFFAQEGNTLPVISAERMRELSPKALQDMVVTRAASILSAVAKLPAAVGGPELLDELHFLREEDGERTKAVFQVAIDKELERFDRQMRQWEEEHPDPMKTILESIKDIAQTAQKVFGKKDNADDTPASPDEVEAQRKNNSLCLANKRILSWRRKGCRIFTCRVLFNIRAIQRAWRARRRACRYRQVWKR